MATLDVSPTRVRKSQTKTITFIGSGTSWQSSAPVFSASVVSGITAGSVTVVSNTVATVPITYGSNVGVATWTDSSSSATCKQAVQNTLIGGWFPGL